MTTSAAAVPDLASLAASLRSGAVELGEYLDRLEREVAGREPSLKALVEDTVSFPDLRRQAEELVESFPDPASRPALFGVPVGVKDVFHVEGFPTRAGSRLPSAELAGEEAAVVTDLKAAGALILGKTQTTEFAYFGPGPTRNPWDPAHTPGGSSSGSAAAVAAGFCPLALGTQTIGSISRPASFCGVVGYKPSYGRISRRGLIPLAPSLDHVGWFTPDVAGAERVATVLCRGWRPVYGESLPVLGIPGGPYLRRAEGEGRTFFRQVCRRLTAAGHAVLRVEAMPDFDGIEIRHRAIVAAEAARVHRAWFERFADLYHPKTRELIETGLEISDSELETALTGCEALRAELESLRRATGVDVWISPAAPGAAPAGLASTGDPVMNLPWTHAGLPTLAIPAGASPGGLPMGLQLAGGWQRDEDLFGWGRRAEATLRTVST